MKVSEMNWRDVESAAARDPRCVLPIGSTEQHAQLSMCVDLILAEKVANAAAEPLDIPVLPVMPYGLAPYFSDYPGTISLRIETLMAVVRDIVASLHRSGFRQILIVNGHGGNIATVTATFSEIWADASFAGESRPAPRLRLYNWWSGERVRGLSRELFGGAEGSHATPSEVSLSYYAYPQAVKQAPLSPKVAPVGTIRDAADYRRQFADGRIGSDPSLASVEHGERLYHAAVADVGEDLRRFGSTD